MRTLQLLVVALLAVPAVAGPALAQEEMTGVRAMGMGEAFTGGPTGTGSLYLNPAGISALMMYSVETAYVYDQATGRNLLHASIVDGKSNPSLGGGIGYTFAISGQDAPLPDFRSHDLYGALAFPIVPGWMLMGASVHYLNYDQFSKNLADGVTMDAGLLVSLGDVISVGAAARHLIDIDGAGFNREARFGLAFHSGSAQVGFDTLVDFAADGPQTSYMAGAEVMALQRLPIRVGYHYDGALEHHIISAGVGWRSELLGVDALYRQDVNERDNRMFGLAVNIYL
jgi:hypothetical protein